MTSLLLLLLGCWRPRDTGPTSMVGSIVDAAGQPLAGLDVETVEARWVTDEAGNFAVNYKEPTQWLMFDHRGVRFRRTYRPSDAGRKVTLTLPELGAGLVTCDLGEECQALLTWELDGAFVAEVRAPCVPRGEDPYPAPALPPGPPDTVTCRTGATAPELPAHARTTPSGLEITPPPVTIGVDLGTTHAQLPTRCQVFVDDRPAEPSGDGLYLAESFGFVEVEAVCDGIPALPRRVYVRSATTLTLDWTPAAPTLDLSQQLPWADVLAVSVLSRDPRLGWSVVLKRGADGTFTLPPLQPGGYAISAGMSPERAARSMPATQLAPGVLHMRLLDPDAREGDAPEALGLLEVADRPLGAVTIPVQWYEGG